MILRYILGSRKFFDLLEGRGPFRDFGAGHEQAHGRPHGSRGESDVPPFAAFGPFGVGRGRRGGFGSGRKIGSADLQAVLLSLLADKPSYGYELIKALEERSGGFYVPSPGMIYPALTYLEELGHATVEVEGARKLYRITDDGKAHVEQSRAVVDAIMAEFVRIGSRMDDIRRAMDGDDGARSDEHHDLHAARHAIRAALHAKRRSSGEEAKRIAGILQRAASEILSS